LKIIQGKKMKACNELLRICKKAKNTVLAAFL
jgi:hypothetical protein